MRVPAAVMSAGMRELAMRSQSRRVAAGRPGVPISMAAELGLRMSGMAAEMARMGGSEEPVGASCSGCPESCGSRRWRCRGTGDRRRGGWSGTKSARRASASWRRVCDGAVADGAVDVGGEGDVAAEAGVAAEEDDGWPRRGGRCATRRGGRWGPGRERRRGRGCLRADGAGVGGRWCRCGRGGPSRRRCHCWGSGSQRAKSASVREKGVFSWSSLRLMRAPVASM